MEERKKSALRRSTARKAFQIRVSPAIMDMLDATLVGIQAQTSTTISKAEFIEAAFKYYCNEMALKHNGGRPFQRKKLNVVDLLTPEETDQGQFPAELEQLLLDNPEVAKFLQKT
jgi:hypothetical protein